MDQYVARTLKDGTVVTTGGLARSADTVRVRIKSGRITVTDGPFTESKEVIGGYAVIAARTRDEAIRCHRGVHAAAHRSLAGWEGECELRELVFLAP
jgi:hypothetical protein